MCVQWKPMLLKPHSRWCWSSIPHWRANNALAMRFSVCIGTHAVVKPRMVFPWCWSFTQHWLRTLLRLVPTSCRRNHCWNRTGYSLGVLVNALQSVNAQQSVFTRQYSAERSGALFRSFAAKDSRTSLLIKRHTYRSLIRTCFQLVQKILPVLIWKRD